MVQIQRITFFVLLLVIVLPGCQEKVPQDAPKKLPQKNAEDSSSDTPVVEKKSVETPADSSSEETSPTPPMTVASQETSLPNVEVNVRDLPNFIGGDNETFAKEHETHELILTGYVHSFMVAHHHPSQQEAPVAVLCAPEKEAATFSPSDCDFKSFVHCYFLDSYPWDKLGKGAKVSLRGKFINVRGQRLLDNCQIVSAEGMPSPKYTAPELTAAVEENYEEIDKKHKKTQVVVSGVVKGFSPTDDNPKPLLLAGTDTLDIEISGLSKNQSKDVNVGDKVSVIGDFVLLGDASNPEIIIDASFRFDNLK